jgi:hypothetical protein
VMWEGRSHWSPGYLEWLSKKIEEGRSRSIFFFPVFATQPCFLWHVWIE